MRCLVRGFGTISDLWKREDGLVRPSSELEADVDSFHSFPSLFQSLQTVRLHTSLAKQLETDHQLTIARESFHISYEFSFLESSPVDFSPPSCFLPESNLVMQEANAEMLEEALRRGGEFRYVTDLAFERTS